MLSLQHAKIVVLRAARTTHGYRSPEGKARKREAASDALQARELVGTRRVDRSIALAFFGDAKRLQRDVLGDAAARLIEHAVLSQIS